MSATNGPVAAVVTSLLGSRPVSAVFRRATGSRLRVVAYHEVPDADAFAAQLDHIAEHYHPIGGADVAAAIIAGRPLRERSVWITFDDGDPTVVRTALPLLRSRGMSATVFVCAGLIGTDTAHWWNTVSLALENGVLTRDDLGVEGRRSVLTAVKQLDDSKRRTLVASITDRLTAASIDPRSDQLTVADLHVWRDAGCDVGNHSWDHPRLDRCTPDEQRRQILLAHHALAEMMGAPPDLFAWPNGDAAPASLEELHELGYKAVLDFDHRLCPRLIDPWSIPRLRLDSDDEMARTRAVLSGAHSTVFSAAKRLRKVGARNG